MITSGRWFCASWRNRAGFRQPAEQPVQSRCRQLAKSPLVLRTELCRGGPDRLGEPGGGLARGGGARSAAAARLVGEQQPSHRRRLARRVRRRARSPVTARRRGGPGLLIGLAGASRTAVAACSARRRVGPGPPQWRPVNLAGRAHQLLLLPVASRYSSLLPAAVVWCGFVPTVTGLAQPHAARRPASGQGRRRCRAGPRTRRGHGRARYSGRCTPTRFAALVRPGRKRGVPARRSPGPSGRRQSRWYVGNPDHTGQVEDAEQAGPTMGNARVGRELSRVARPEAQALWSWQPAVQQIRQLGNSGGGGA